MERTKEIWKEGGRKEARREGRRRRKEGERKSDRKEEKQERKGGRKEGKEKTEIEREKGKKNHPKSLAHRTSPITNYVKVFFKPPPQLFSRGSERNSAFSSKVLTSFRMPHPALVELTSHAQVWKRLTGV